MIYSKLKALEWSQHFSHYKSMGIFKDAQGLLTPGFDLAKLRTHPSFMQTNKTCKNEEDLIKNEGTKVVTTLSMNV